MSRSQQKSKNQASVAIIGLCISVAWWYKWPTEPQRDSELAWDQEQGLFFPAENLF